MAFQIPELSTTEHACNSLLQVASSVRLGRAKKISHHLIATNTSRKSLCKDSKLIPEVYVLGAKNTATSSLYNDLHEHSVTPAPHLSQKPPEPGSLRKEWTFFKAHAGEESLEALWSDSLPACPSGARKVMADFSVTNLFTFQLPSDLRWSTEFGYPSKEKKGAVESWDTARRILEFSGSAGSALKMLVMLREPLERIQSEYYHTLELRNCMGCMANGSFAESFKTNVELLKHSPPEVTDWFWKSFYARHIEEFLRYFDAAQFMFVPMRQYIDPSTSPAFSRALLNWLDISEEPWKEASHKNEHEDRPPLDSELETRSASRRAFQAFMDVENRRLVSILAKAHVSGAQLAGYSGKPGDLEQTRRWLESSW